MNYAEAPRERRLKAPPFRFDVEVGHEAGRGREEGGSASAGLEVPRPSTHLAAPSPARRP